MEDIIKYWVEVLFGIICTIFACGFKMISAKIKEQNQKQLAIENGVQALLRDRLIERYRECCLKGELSILDRENLNHMFEEYLNLKGNGTVKQLMNDLLDLPTKKEN